MIEFSRLLVEPAPLAIVLSLLFATVSLAATLLLYVRRRMGEQRLAREAELDRDLPRQLMAALASPAAAQAIRLPSHVRSADLERVFAHLMQLLRGTDREKLLQVADDLQVPDRALADLQQSRTPRRIDAMRLLELFPSPRVVAAIRQRMLADPDRAARTEAAAILARIGQPPSPAEVVDALALETTTPYLLHAAIFRAGAPRYARELVAVADRVRSGALQSMLVEALGWAEDDAILADLARFAGADAAETRIASLKAARNLGHASVRDWAIPLLLDPNDDVRVQAARTCGQLGFSDAIPILSKLVENSSWWVRTRAAEALAVLRPEQPAPFAVTGLRK